MAKKTALIVYNPLNEEAIKASQRAQIYLERQNIRVIRQLHKKSKIDFAVSLGGDGTALWTAKILAQLGFEAPVLAVNFGSVGALCTAQKNQLLKALDCAAKGKYTTDRRLRIEMTVMRKGKAILSAHALNEFAFNRRKERAVAIEVTDNDIPLNLPKGDGLIVATYTGSKAYALSAGGKMIRRKDGLAAIVICPAGGVGGSALIDGSHKIIFMAPRGNVLAIEVDGHQVKGLKLNPDDTVVIRKSKVSTIFMKVKPENQISG